LLSESARMASAAEARFRIDAPNSKPRAVKVIALDRPSEAAIKQLAGPQWNNATFLTASSFAGATGKREAFSVSGWLSDLAGRTANLMDEVSSADLVVMVATAGQDDQAASIIGEACGAKHVMTTALVLGATASNDEALSRTLATLRPHARMLVISGSDDYIADMLTALRA
jgi:hypothetical protein